MRNLAAINKLVAQGYPTGHQCERFLQLAAEAQAEHIHALQDARAKRAAMVSAHVNAVIRSAHAAAERAQPTEWR